MPVLSRLFQRLVLNKLLAAHQAGQLKFFGDHTALTERKAFATYLAPLRKIEWYVYTKPPFGGPKAVLAYLARYTHRVAISNRRLIALDSRGVTFKYKDYRADGRARYKVMKLATHEFIRRFLIHVLPDGFVTLSVDEARRVFNLGRDAEAWSVAGAQAELKHTHTDKRLIQRVNYRPFDNRVTYYTGRSNGFISRPTHDVMKHLLRAEFPSLDFHGTKLTSHHVLSNDRFSATSFQGRLSHMVR